MARLLVEARRAKQPRHPKHSNGGSRFHELLSAGIQDKFLI